jgi:arylsulfatase A-like enzyme
VHTPHRPKEGADNRKPPAKFREVLAETDRQIGRLLDFLHDVGLERNTIVLVAGDNGPQPTFDRTRSGGLRGMKWSLYEGGVRTPLIVRWPEVIPAGVVNEGTVVSGVDLFPTLCHLAGINAPESVAFDGEDLSAALRGEKVVRQKPLLWEYGRKPGGGGKELGAFPKPAEPDSVSPNVAVRDGDWKLLINADGSGAELYQITADSRETQNVSATESTIASRLRQMALGWRSALP